LLAGCILPLPDPDPAIDPHCQRHIQQAHHPELVTSLAPLATGRLSIHYSRSSARNPPSRPRSLLRPCSSTPIALRGRRRRCHPRTPATVARHTLCRGLVDRLSVCRVVGGALGLPSTAATWPAPESYTVVSPAAASRESFLAHSVLQCTPGLSVLPVSTSLSRLHKASFFPL